MLPAIILTVVWGAKRGSTSLHLWSCWLPRLLHCTSMLCPSDEKENFTLEPLCYFSFKIDAIIIYKGFLMMLVHDNWISLVFFQALFCKKVLVDCTKTDIQSASPSYLFDQSLCLLHNCSPPHYQLQLENTPVLVHLPLTVAYDRSKEWWGAHNVIYLHVHSYTKT